MTSRHRRSLFSYWAGAYRDWGDGYRVQHPLGEAAYAEGGGTGVHRDIECASGDRTQR